MNDVMTLGEVGVPHDDASYTGDTGSSMFGMQYYRNKASEFQTALVAADLAASAAQSAIAADIDIDLSNDLLAMLQEFDAKKTVLRATAEAINFGASTINAAGGRFPQLSIPSGLGVIPLLVPAATVAAIAAAASLVVWVNQWVKGVNQRMMLAQAVALTDDPEKKQALIDAAAQSALAERTADTPLSNVAGIVKWVAIGAVAFFAYKAWQER